MNVIRLSCDGAQIIFFAHLYCFEIFVFSRYYFQSGNTEHPGDKLSNTMVEILTVNPMSVDNDAVRTRFAITEDNFLVIGKFNDEGIAQGKISLSMGSVDTLRLRVLQPAQTWVLLNEVHNLQPA